MHAVPHDRSSFRRRGHSRQTARQRDVLLSQVVVVLPSAFFQSPCPAVCRLVHSKPSSQLQIEGIRISARDVPAPFSPPLPSEGISGIAQVRFLYPFRLDTSAGLVAHTSLKHLHLEPVTSSLSHTRSLR